MRFEYLKIWLRWYWLPYKEVTVLDASFRWLCFEFYLKRQPTKRAAGGYADATYIELEGTAIHPYKGYPK